MMPTVTAQSATVVDQASEHGRQQQQLVVVAVAMGVLVVVCVVVGIEA